MKRGIATVGLGVVVAMIGSGCGGARAGAPPGASEASGATAGGADPIADGGTVALDAGVNGGGAAGSAPGGGGSVAGAAGAALDAGASGAPAGKPFAHNNEEATSFIDDAINSRSSDLVTCVNEDRTRRKDAHARVVVEIGIDEEGHLLGVKLPKGTKADKPLVDCVLAALRGAPFPRSHAGVITVRRTFEDQAVYK